MLSKKKKIIVLCGMVALLVVTGVLNIVLGQASAAPPPDVDSGYQTLFQTYRVDRQATRNQTMLFLDSIISNEASSAEAIADAEAQRLQLVLNMEKELVLEGLIQAVGFEDAFITMSTSNINVIVRADTLTEDEVMRIFSIIVDETGASAQNIIIVPLGTNR